MHKCTPPWTTLSWRTLWTSHHWSWYSALWWWFWLVVMTWCRLCGDQKRFHNHCTGIQVCLIVFSFKGTVTVNWIYIFKFICKCGSSTTGFFLHWKYFRNEFSYRQSFIWSFTVTVHANLLSLQIHYCLLNLFLICFFLAIFQISECL